MSGHFILCDCNDFTYSDVIPYKDDGIQEAGGSVEDRAYRDFVFETGGLKIILGSKDQLEEILYGCDS